MSASTVADADAAKETKSSAGGTPRMPSPPSAALAKDGQMRANLSAVEATSQLKVLCRKFAALTDKVKEETRLREEAEKEVRRLRALVERNETPIIASSRTNTQAKFKELKDAHDKLQQELRAEKDKNGMLMCKALELEKEKSALLAVAASEPHRGNMVAHSVRSTAWDRDQTLKINSTLQTTVDELQEELLRKEEELEAYKERTQFERTRIKELETELHENEKQLDHEHLKLQELDAQIVAHETELEKREHKIAQTKAQLTEELEIRKTLEQQLETLNDVNSALEQRARTLVRRIELNNSVIKECDQLKQHLREMEIDKGTLVRTIREHKEHLNSRELHWKTQLEKIRLEKTELAAQVADCEAEIKSLRAQNTLFSEWMLVRNENFAVQQQAQGIVVHPLNVGETTRMGVVAPNDRSATNCPRNYTPHPATVRPLDICTEPTHEYTHISERFPLSPPKTLSMTAASPIKQFWCHRSPRSMRERSFQHRTTSSCQHDDVRISSREQNNATNDRLDGTFHPSASPARSTKLSDHERLRALMTKNRELQQRLQHETIATRNLEDEIEQLTSTRTQKSD